MDPAEPPPWAATATGPAAASGDPGGGPAGPVAVAGWFAELRVALTVAAVLTVVGVPLGPLWAHLAPHPLVAVAGRGLAQVVGSEPEAFVAADFDLARLLAVVGLLAGAGAFALRAGRRAPVGSLVGLAGGGVCTGAVAAAIGHRVGAAHFDAVLATGRTGTELLAPVGLRATPVLVCAGFVAVVVFGLLYWGLGELAGGPDRLAPASAPPVG